MNKRHFAPWLLLLLLLVSLACQAVTTAPAHLNALVERGTPTLTQTPLSAVPTEPAYSPTTTPLPLQTAEKLPTLADPTVSAESVFEVRPHPDGGLVVGDLVSFEVLAPPGRNLTDEQVSLAVGEVQFDPVEFSPFGIGGRSQATFLWVWDTTGWEPGDYVLEFELELSGESWAQEVELLPETALKPPEPGAAWKSTLIECCRVYYVSGTAAARDLETLLLLVDRQAEEAAGSLGVDFDETLEIVLLPRVLGHGGFASSEIAISYLDRNYANNDFAQVLHHEMVHWLDRELGGDYKPSLFVEGLAVYLSGGHFKPEPLLKRAAALPELGLYIPLQPLLDDFYHSQHEIGYLQAGALVQYLVETWGWEAFSAFYRDIPDLEGQAPSSVVDSALQEHYGLTLAELEKRFQIVLLNQASIPDLRTDVYQTVAFYNTLRRYQKQLDPSAYFLTAWLLNGEEMRQKGIVADYLRRPQSPENITLEALLTFAGDQLVLGRYPEVQRTLAAVNSVLDGLERGDPEAFQAHPLAAEALRLVQGALNRGIEVRSIDLRGSLAYMEALNSNQEKVQLDWRKDSEGWILELGN